MALVKVKDQDDIIVEFPAHERVIIDRLEEYGFLHVMQIEERYKTSKVFSLRRFAHKSSLAEQILIAISNHGAFIDDKLTRLYYIFKSIGSIIALGKKYITFDYYSESFHSGDTKYDSFIYITAFYSYVSQVQRCETFEDIVCGGVDRRVTRGILESLLPDLKYKMICNVLFVKAEELRRYLNTSDF